MIVYVGFYTLFNVFSINPCLKIFDLRGFLVVSGSMEPVLSVNDLLITNTCPDSSLEEGDIIVFEMDINNDGKNEKIVHYLDEIIESELGLTYKTIRHFEETPYFQDGWTLNDEDIIAKYLFTVPMIGNVLVFLRSPLGWMVVLMNGLLYFSYEYHKRKKRIPNS